MLSSPVYVHEKLWNCIHLQPHPIDANEQFCLMLDVGKGEENIRGTSFRKEIAEMKV